MNLSTQDYVGLVRDSKWENDLAQSLRMRPESERLEFLLDFVNVNLLAGLTLARRCLSDQQSFEVLLEHGLTEADSSSIRYWLECVVPRLGFCRVIALLKNNLLPNPQAVARAKYWLPLFSQEVEYSANLIRSLETA